MAPQALSTPRFVRKTKLASNEYRKNFHQIDRDIMAAITSEEADCVTPLMSKIYLRLLNAPGTFWEREGVLRIEAEFKGEKSLKAWGVLCHLVDVSSATASKALRWMHEQGIIGYFSGKNGVGIRIFLNRASSSIGVRPGRVGERILAFPPASPPASFDEPPASSNEAAFNDPFGVLESLDKENTFRAPENGADARQDGKNSSTRPPDARPTPPPDPDSIPAAARATNVISLEEIVRRLRVELEPSVQAAARQAAAREHERTREWLESRGLPKAARVAQRETYDVLRKHGLIVEAACSQRLQAEVGRNSYAPPAPHPISDEEVNDLAQACLAMLETQGRSIEVTLSEMGSEAGGFLLPEDAGRVREKATLLLSAGRVRRGN